MKRIRFPLDEPGKKDISNLHTALRKLGLDVAPEEASRNQLGKTTKAAIRKFKRRARLKPYNSELTPETVERLNVELEHAYYAASKTRTSRLHARLTRLGYELDPDDVKRRIVGPSTEAALKDFQEKAGLAPDG